MMRRWRAIGAALFILILLGLATAWWMLANARAMPVVRRVAVTLPFPPDAPRRAITVALLTDTHLSGPDNSPARMARIVDRINRLKPDLVVLGGDYMGDWKGSAIYDAAASIAPFAALRAPLGVVAVPGNHDLIPRGDMPPSLVVRAVRGLRRMIPGALPAQDRRLPDERAWARAFGGIGIPLLANGALRRGPLAVGGLADIYTGRPDIPATLAAMRAVGGAPLLLSHSPDVFPRLPATDPMLLLVGHTHCGQIALPWIGAIYVPSIYGTRYACGVYRRGATTMVVAAGVGTSGLPLRAFAPPDIWLVTVRPR
jgi:predicted MPP superfamily phosphohydrolase